MEYACAIGYKKIAITDRNTLAGIVRAHAAAREKDIQIIPAARLDLIDGPSLLAYPTDKGAYGRLSGLLSTGNLRTEKGKCALFRRDVYAHSEGIIFIAVAPDELNTDFDFEPGFERALKDYRDALGDQLYISASRGYLGNDAKKLYRLSQIADRLGIPLVATNDVHYHHPERRQLQDILTCIREKCTIYNAGFLLHQNAERYLKPEKEMLRLFRAYPDAIRRSQQIADACQFTLDSLKYVYPEEITSEGRSPEEELTYLAWKGARDFYGDPAARKSSKCH